MTLNTGEHTLHATPKRKTIRDGPRELQGTTRKWYRPQYVDKATQTERRTCSFEDSGVQTTLHPATNIELQHLTSPLTSTHLLHKSTDPSGRWNDSRRTSSSHGETLESVAHIRIAPGELAIANDVGAQLLLQAPSHSPSRINSAIVPESPIASFSTSAAEGDCREPAPLLSTNHEHRYGGTSLSPVGLLEPCPTLNSPSGAAGAADTFLFPSALPGSASSPLAPAPVAVRQAAEGLDDILRSTAHTLAISPSSAPLQVKSTPAHDRGGATSTKDTPVAPPTGDAYSAADGSTLASKKETTLLDDEHIVDAGSETSEHYADLAPEMAFFLDMSSPPAFETTFLRDEDKDDGAAVVHVSKPDVTRANELRAPVDGNREAYGGPLTDTYEDSQDGCAFATSRNIVACALAQVNGDALLIG